MKKIKIVQAYYTRTAAKEAVTYQKQLARKNNLLISNVEVISAESLFKANGWFKSNPFKKLGLPAPEQFMVIVHYSCNVLVPRKLESVARKIDAAKKKGVVSKAFFVVKLSPHQELSLSKFKSIYSVCTSTPVWKYKYTMDSSSSFRKTINIQLPRGFQYIAA